MRIIIIFIALVSISTARFLPQASSDVVRHATIDRIKNTVKSKNSALHHASYNRLAYLVDTFGPRMWGSDSLNLAIDNLYGQLQNIGFDRVEKENLGNIRTWRRLEESLTLYDPRPFPQKLNVIGLGLGAPGNVTAEVIVVKDFEHLESLGPAKVAGKIVCFNQGWTNYGHDYAFRTQGPPKIQKLGGVGFLLRSIAPFSIDSPHTGTTHYDLNYPEIPAAAISVEDAEMFQRMQDRGQKIVVNLNLDSEWYDSTSDNLIADITGSEFPEEVLVMGGHIDSWDTGSQTGANDDGGGVMVCLEALRVLKVLGIRPRRTIRLVAWSGEEMGLANNGAEVYANKHQYEKTIIAFESDEGTTKPYGFGFTGNVEATKIIHELADKYLIAIKASQINDNDGDMVDNGYLGDLGVPMLRNLIEDNESNDFYFTYHHSAGDSMYMMNPEDMDDNVIAIASIFYLIADLDKPLPRD